MKEEYGYLDDGELEALIAEVENGGMIAPPVYLKGLIMEEVSRKAKAVRKAKAQFLVYSFKIVAAAAVAVFCLTMIPMDFNGGGMAEDGGIEQRIEKDTKRYQEEKEKALAGNEGIGGELRGFLGGRLGLAYPEGVDGIFNGFSKWFGMEEESYE